MLLDHALLALAIAALGAAALRAAAQVAPAGLARIVAAAPLGVAAAVVEALLLGRVGLAGSPLALAAAAAATWLVSTATLPAAIAWSGWRSLGWAERWAGAASGGAIAALVAWMWRHPALGVDGVVYHLTEITGWVHAGSTGTTPFVSAEFPTGSYPLTNEAALAWAMGLAHSFTPVALWMGAMVAMVVAAGWLGLRTLGTGRVVTAMTIGAVVALPLAALQLNTVKNDMPSLAWLACTAALCAVAGVRAAPRALAPALVAAGLAVGSKTTTAPLAVVALVLGAWECRRDLRPAARPLVLAAALAVAAGGVWYLRNSIAHGSPMWPFSPGPFGDPEPSALKRIDVTFLSRPRATLAGREDLYLRLVAGGAVLLAGGIGAAVLARRRSVALASGATALALLSWVSAPFTGIAGDPRLDLSITTTRYLLPAMAAGAVALALAARTSRIARGLLALALLWSLARTARLGFPDTPSAATLVAGALAGLLAAAATRAAVRAGLGRVAAAVAVAALVGAATGAAPGFLARHGAANATAHAGVERWFAALPDWAQRREPVALSPEVIGTLAGDRLRHRVSLVPPAEGCAAVRARIATGFVVIRDSLFPELLAPARAPGCFAGVAPLLHEGPFRVYGPARQIATRSSASSSPSARSEKSSTPIAAARGSSSRRARVSSTS